MEAQQDGLSLLVQEPEVEQAFKQLERVLLQAPVLSLPTGQQHQLLDPSVLSRAQEEDEAVLPSTQSPDSYLCEPQKDRKLLFGKDPRKSVSTR